MNEPEDKESLKAVLIKGLIIGVVILALAITAWLLIPAIFVGLSLSGWE